MKLSSIAMAVALGTTCMLTACTQDGSQHEPQEAPSPGIESGKSFDSRGLDSQSDTEIPPTKGNETESIMAFLGTDRVLLAHREITLPDEAHPSHAIVLRHINQAEAHDPSWNPCELMIIRRTSDSYEMSGRTTKAVDCTHIAFAREVATSPDDLNDYLGLDNESGRVTYSNHYTRSVSIYSFEYSKEKDEWHLSGARNSYPLYNPESEEMQAVVEEIRYPDDFGWISMHDFDPEDLLEALMKNRTVD